MWQRTVVFHALALLLSVATFGFAQQPPTAKSLPSLRQWVRFEVVQGRLTANGTHSRRAKNFVASDTQAKRQESFSISYQKERRCTVQYRSSCPRQQLRVDFLSDGQVEIVRQPNEQTDIVYLHYRQASDRPVRLVLGQGNSAEEYTANSFWHLLLAEPDVCNRHLLPILHRLRGGWHLAEQAREIEEAVVKLARDDSYTHRDWSRLIDQLDSEKFQERQSADQQLRRGGLDLLFHLQQIDTDKLAAEQRVRISKIRKSLTGHRADTPPRIAIWLIDDPGIWLTMLSHETLSHRQTAVEQLTRIHGRPIDFNPTVNAALQKSQIERLRRQIATGN